MENRSGETNNPQNSAENAFDYAAADITNELPRGDMLQDPAEIGRASCRERV